MRSESLDALPYTTVDSDRICGFPLFSAIPQAHITRDGWKWTALSLHEEASRTDKVQDS